ncbi:hypothetical protein PROP_02642 [Propionicimonas sp. T2.31MG-18]
MSGDTVPYPCPEWCETGGEPGHEWRPATGGFHRRHMRRFGRFSVVQVERGYGASTRVLGAAEVIPEPVLADAALAAELRAAFTLRRAINAAQS